MEADALYKLLPAIYRIRDSEHGKPLQALLQVMGEQFAHLHADVERLYDNWFIETCDDWVVPYLGELVGFRRSGPLGETGDSVASDSLELLRRLYPRREVSQLVHIRRRKGTLLVLENLAHNLGWKSMAVEDSRFLAISWIAKYACLLRCASINLHDQEMLPRLNTPFDRSVRSVDVRSQRFWPPLRPNPHGLTLFVWRREPRSVSQVEPRLVRTRQGWNLLSFSPYALDMPLVMKGIDDPADEDPDPECLRAPCHKTTDTPATSPESHERVDHRDESQYPTFLRRHLLHENQSRYFGENKSLSIPEIENRIICVRNLARRSALARLPNPSPDGVVYLDPELGLLAVPDTLPITNITYHHPVLARMGGGEYPRVVAKHNAYPVYRFLSRSSKQSLWSAFYSSRSEIAASSNGSVIESSVGFELASSSVYRSRLGRLRIRQNQTLELRAANQSRPVLQFDANGVLQPILIELEPGSRLVLDGVTILAARIDVRSVEASFAPPRDADPACEPATAPPDPPGVYIRHSTIAPWVDESFRAETGAPRRTEAYRGAHGRKRRRLAIGSIHVCLPGGQFVARDSVLSSLHVEDACAAAGSCPRDPVSLQLYDSIVDGSIAGPSKTQPAFAALDCARSTILGKTTVHQIDSASDMIFLKKVRVRRRQVGYVRFSYVSAASRSTPSLYRCRPQPGELLSPRFVSQRFGEFGYAQLHVRCPEEIRRGAESASEMGAFHNLFEPQRRARLESQLEEFTPAEMHSRLLFVDESLP